MRELKKVRWGLIAAIFAVPVLAVSIIVIPARVVWTLRETYGQKQMTERLEALKAAGVPIDDASVEAVYLENTSSVSTDRWLAVMAEFESDEFKKSQIGVYNFDPQLEEVPFEPSAEWTCEPATRRFIETREPLLHELRDLCHYREPVRFPYYFDSINTQLPYLQHMRDVGRMLLTDGQIAIRDRDSARVRSDIEALLDSAVVCSEEPWMVSRLVCMSLEFRAIELLKQALENDRLVSDDLNELLPRFIERSKLTNQWQVMIEGERSTQIPCFVELHRFGTPGGKYIPPRGWDCLIYLELMDKALAIDASSLDSLLAAARELDAEFTEGTRSAGWLRKLDSLTTSLMAPSFAALAESIARNLSENRLAAHALAVAIFRESHGRWPSDLSQVNLSQSDLDPPGGRPFGYRVDPDGRACLWGFDVQTTHSTPPEPPPLDLPAGEADKNERCIWHIASPD